MEFNVNISAGRRDRYETPIWIELSPEQAAHVPELGLVLADEVRVYPAQRVTTGGREFLVAIISHEGVGEDLTLQVQAADEPVPTTGTRRGVAVQSSAEKLDFIVDGRPFTSYVYSRKFAKPFWGPIFVPGADAPVTRLDLEIKEHPHQRSLWFSHGNVNGIDTWNEKAEKHGRQIHQELLGVQDGPVLGWMEARNVWTDFHENPLADETRTFAAYRTVGDAILADLSLTLTATYGEVHLGPTKEAGPLGIRVAPSMTGQLGGVITNALGAVGESECRGARAQWLDYTGLVQGQQMGIAALDHPQNPDHPTNWHVREYGLMAPNNFAWGGECRIATGESLTFRFRMVFHQGDAERSRIKARWLDYAYPPTVQIS